MDGKRINQLEVSKIIGWDQGRISKYLSGKMIPSIIHAKTLANAAGVDFVELCDFIIEKKEMLDAQK